jgi:hypothetical protein
MFATYVQYVHSEKVKRQRKGIVSRVVERGVIVISLISIEIDDSN